MFVYLSSDNDPSRLQQMSSLKDLDLRENPLSEDAKQTLLSLPGVTVRLGSASPWPHQSVVPFDQNPTAKDGCNLSGRTLIINVWAKLNFDKSFLRFAHLVLLQIIFIAMYKFRSF